MIETWLFSADEQPFTKDGLLQKNEFRRDEKTKETAIRSHDFECCVVVGFDRDVVVPLQT